MRVLLSILLILISLPFGSVKNNATSKDFVIVEPVNEISVASLSASESFDGYDYFVDFKLQNVEFQFYVPKTYSAESKFAACRWNDQGGRDFNFSMVFYLNDIGEDNRLFVIKDISANIDWISRFQAYFWLTTECYAGTFSSSIENVKITKEVYEALTGNNTVAFAIVDNDTVGAVYTVYQRPGGEYKAVEGRTEHRWTDLISLHKEYSGELEETPSYDLDIEQPFGGADSSLNNFFKWLTSEPGNYFERIAQIVVWAVLALAGITLIGVFFKVISFIVLLFKRL